MKRLMALLIACLMVGLVSAPGTVHGQKQKKDEVPPERREIPGLIEQLKSKDGTTRATAAHRLALAGQVQGKLISAAIPTLMDMVKTDSDAGARSSAAQALGYATPEPEKTVPLLITVLKDDKDYGVKQAAARALGYFGPEDGKAAVPALRETQDMVKGAGKDEKDKTALNKACGDALKMIAGKGKK
jgi:HEAT repeat protein